MSRHDMPRHNGPTRRQIMTAAGASALVLSSGAGLARRPALARGYVFEDRTGTGRRHAGDPGVAGVMVSNGRDVVLSDADGRWQLGLDGADSVFLIKPPQWTTPHGRGGVPLFHRACPAGGAAEMTPLSVDFPLRRQSESSRFEALLLADTQPGSDEELSYLRDDIVAAAMEHNAAFAINHGDVVFDDAALYARYLDITGTTHMPWHHCPGNHDIDYDAPDDARSRETWKRIFGPRHYAFRYAGATFIVLDNVHYYGRNAGDPMSGKYRGLIGAEQLAFVRNVLAHVPPIELIVVSMHIPLTIYQDPGSTADTTADAGALLALLSDRPHSVSFSGHMHTTEHHYLGTHAHHHQVLAAASGGWWGGPHDRRGIPFADSSDGVPNGFHVLSVEGNRYTTEFVPAAGKSQGRLRVVVDGPHRHRAKGICASGASVCSEEIGGCALIVNVFDGGPRTRVTCEVAGPTSAPVRGAAMRLVLERTPATDPVIAELFVRQPGLQKPWVEALPSPHIWRAPLPTGLAAGAYRLTVTAHDEYGREIRVRSVLEVAARDAAGPRA